MELYIIKTSEMKTKHITLCVIVRDCGALLNLIKLNNLDPHISHERPGLICDIYLCGQLSKESKSKVSKTKNT